MNNMGGTQASRRRHTDNQGRFRHFVVRVQALCKNGKSSECFKMGFSQVSQHLADCGLTFEAKEALLVREIF
jgi:hypothetical protein